MKSIVYIIIVLFSVSTLIISQEKIKIPTSTVVVVKSTKKLSSKHLRTGQEIDLVVVVDVTIKGATVIKAGAPVIGIVQSAESAGMVGQAGNLVISIQSTVAVDGTTIALSGNFYTKGESKTGQSVAIGVILCPLALLCKGEEGDIPANAQARALTIGEYETTIETSSPKDAPQDNTPPIQEPFKETEFKDSFTSQLTNNSPQSFFGGKVSLTYESSTSGKSLLKAKGIWGFSENNSGLFEQLTVQISKGKTVFMQIDEKTIYKIIITEEASDTLSLELTKVQ